MPARTPAPDPAPTPAIPLWMRRGTLWVILLLSAAGLALLMHYLLPGWWAALVVRWVQATTTWTTGLLLGFIPVTVGVAAIWAAWGSGARRGEESPGPTVGERLRPVFSAVAGLAIGILVLNILIAGGLSGPLREASALWQREAPGVLAAMLSGALAGLVAVLGVLSLAARIRNRRLERALESDDSPRPATAPESDDEEPGG